MSYKQGLNEILAPLLLLFSRVPGAKTGNPGIAGGSGGLTDDARDLVFTCFYAFVSQHLPSIYSGHQFESLQCYFGFFNLLLRYHDPELSSMLTLRNMLPELYAVPWFLTLFARKTPLALVMALWDAYIIDGDPFLHVFVALALLTQNREALLKAPEDDLVPTLTALGMKTLNEVRMRVAEVIFLFFN